MATIARRAKTNPGLEHEIHTSVECKEEEEEKSLERARRERLERARRECLEGAGRERLERALGESARGGGYKKKESIMAHVVLCVKHM
eukprot:737856-Amorphochlora_amoeboformis.AAC.1